MAKGDGIFPNAVIQTDTLAPFRALDKESTRVTGNIQAREAADAKAAQKAQAARTSQLNEMLDFTPTKYWEPFSQNVNDFTQNHVRDWVTSEFNSGRDFSDPNFVNEYNRRKGNVQQIADRTKHMQNNFDQTRKLIQEQGENVDSGYYYDRLNKMMFGKDLNSPDLSKVDPRQLRGLIENDLGGYNKGKIYGSFVENLPENLEQTYRIAQDKFGSRVNYQKIKAANIVRRDPITGLPMINITDDTVKLANDDPYLSRLMSEAESKGISNKDFLTKELKPYISQQREARTTALPGAGRSGGGGRTPEEQVEERFVSTTTKSILNSFDPESGTFNDEGRVGVESLQTFRGKPILNRSLEPGGGEITVLRDTGRRSKKERRYDIRFNPKTKKTDVVDVTGGEGTAHIIDQGTEEHKAVVAESKNQGINMKPHLFIEYQTGSSGGEPVPATIELDLDDKKTERLIKESMGKIQKIDEVVAGEQVDLLNNPETFELDFNK